MRFLAGAAGPAKNEEFPAGHAAELLKEAWHSPDARERLQKQTRFTDLMLTITEDLTDLSTGATPKALPEKTIAFIQNKIG